MFVAVKSARSDVARQFPSEKLDRERTLERFRRPLLTFSIDYQMCFRGVLRNFRALRFDFRRRCCYLVLSWSLSRQVVFSSQKTTFPRDFRHGLSRGLALRTIRLGFVKGLEPRCLK